MIIHIGIKKFPRSFQLLQQEAFLANSCVLSGFEYLTKARFEDVGKGLYYSAFFQLSIGLERIAKLVIMTDHMIENNFTPMPEKQLRSKAHELTLLYEECFEIRKKYLQKSDNDFSKNSIEWQILDFFNKYADSKGRYYNISNISSENQNDPFKKNQGTVY